MTPRPISGGADAGSTSTGAVDPLDAIADYCETHGIWLHADAAYGGFAAITEPGAHLLRGIERADSIGIDPHKWFFQPYDTGCLLVRDVTTLERAFAIHHDVLQDSVWGANHPNQADRGLQLSRRDRALNNHTTTWGDVCATLETIERFGNEALQGDSIG